MHSSLLLLPAFVAGAVAASSPLALRDLGGPPTVTLDSATVIGKLNGSVVHYLGIPFAQPPIGDLRLRAPQPISPFTGTVNATAFGNQCIQQTFPNLTFPADVPAAVGQYLSAFVTPAPVPESEDCLNLNVIVPANATQEDKLPVVVWIYGGGFQAGSNAVFPGEAIVARSVEIGHPVIYMAMNYRLSAFGFLGGKEVKEAGVANLGLLDQRESLKWIQKYISAFGGDPEKVMIWGESAGAISVAHHMLANNGDPQGLFRAGFMESGSPAPVGQVDNPYLQTTYDTIVVDAGCADSANSLSCLRQVPTGKLKAAMDQTPTFLSFKQLNTPWFPRADGGYIKQEPQHQLISGAIATIPFVIGNDLDEGSALSFPTLNLTTDDEVLDYIQANFFRNTSRAVVANVLNLYPQDPAAGSPFGTGSNHSYSPQYKRISAIQGDFFEQAPRRLFVQQLGNRQSVYNYLSEIDQVDGIGAAHGTELTNIYGGGDMADYLIRFAATLDPNGDGAPAWPRYTTENPALLTFRDRVPFVNVTMDTYRIAGMAFLTQLSLADPI
ncbi:carotenoid ester lipase [Epithele typhae]|uniref:carotenoid ester lipase n=1 Tax=Epithele typhae TaxID=378194 RepID=UPI0020088652|nr:carotenoid ester lipase [Epithele typhae]KAH9915056.1 carotenoid ester lipase [Epithele typhae]